MMPSNGQLTVPPGFRFHPTDEELLYYYLRKKVSYEAIDLDVIREVDLNKLEPWDLKDRCRIGSGPQNEWYFFSHKDKKYPTGTRTNRATIAGFWKATGRDKAIYLSNSRRIGMRKTLVFYTGRAPHGQKTDWIMHEYRLDDDDLEVQIQNVGSDSSILTHSLSLSQRQEDGWVVCRVFKKKNYNRGFQADQFGEEEDVNQVKSSGQSHFVHQKQQNHHHHHHRCLGLYDYNLDVSMHMPQLFSPESTVPTTSYAPPSNLNNMDVLECSQNLLRLTSDNSVCGTNLMQQERLNGDWSFLDKLLASNGSHGGLDLHKCNTSMHAATMGTTSQKFPFIPYLPFESGLMKYHTK